ncbi:MAG: hypothetical protein ACK5QC_03350 [Bacteroidota bacterium]
MFANSSSYIFVYDFLNEPPRVIAPLICFSIGFIGVILIKQSLRKNGISELKKFFLGFLLISAGFFLCIYTLSLCDYFTTRKLCEQNKLSVTAGYVTNLKINTKGKNDNMEFYINHECFRYYSNDLTYYGCTYSDLKKVKIQDSTFLIIRHIKKGGENITLRVIQILVKSNQ